MQISKVCIVVTSKNWQAFIGYKTWEGSSYSYSRRGNTKPGTVVHAYSPIGTQENLEFKVSLGNLTRPYLKIKKAGGVAHGSVSLDSIPNTTKINLKNKKGWGLAQW